MNRRGFLQTATGALATAAIPLDQLWMRTLSDELKADAKIPDASAFDDAQPSLSFYEFVQQAWSQVEPRSTFVDNWHIRLICALLEMVTRGEIRKLLINIPPGCMKSLLVSVLWPAWEWTFRPHYRYLCASYDQTLSTRDNLKVRALVESAWYRERFPDVVLKHDQNQKTKFETTVGGYRIGTSVGGRATGEHPHRKITDDPHNREQAFSELERQKAIDFQDKTLGSRGAAVTFKSAEIVIMQRLHDGDLSGHIISKYGDEWVVVCLPMRFERVDPDTGLPRMKALPGGLCDPRTVEGELLWPAMFPEEAVAKLEHVLDTDAPGQLQQRPTDAKGGMFEDGWFEIIDVLPADIIAWSRGWDGAGTEDGGDYSVGLLMGKTSKGFYVIADVARGQWGPGTSDDKMLAVARADAATYGRGAVAIREEQEPGSAGKKIIAAHRILLAGHDYGGEHSTGPKTSRWKPFKAQAKPMAGATYGNVKLLRGPWNRDYLDEVKRAPRGKHDDQLDATHIAFDHVALAVNTFTQVRVIG